jgi:hypothetical protein
MISQLEDTDGGILTFTSSYLDWIQDQDFEKNHRPWGLGRVYDDPTDSFVGRLEDLG